MGIWWKCPHCGHVFHGSYAGQDRADEQGCSYCPRPDAHVEDFREHARLSGMIKRKARAWTAADSQDLEDWCQENKGLRFMHPSDRYCEIAGAPAHLRSALQRACRGARWHKSQDVDGE